jgi:hypothetical protein
MIRRKAPGSRTCGSAISIRATALDYHRPMHEKWWEETVHALVVIHNWQQQKQLDEAIRELVRQAVLRAELEGLQQGYEEGKRRAVN